MKSLHGVATILLIIGGINWGLQGLGMWFGTNLNIVNLIIGGISWLEATVYVLVGLSAIYLVLTHKKTCRECDKNENIAVGV